MMKKLIPLAAAVAGLAAPAGAVTVVLEGTSAEAGGTRFNYGGSFAIDPGTTDSVEGLVSGSQVVIFDFKGYVDGSITSPIPQVTASTELVSNADLLPPGLVDDPNIVNLVFTWNDGDFTPDPGFAFTGFSALSTLSGIDATGSAFGSYSLKVTNGTDLYVLGFVGSPTAVPEPAVWTMMLLGFGLVGSGMRGRRTRAVTA